MEPELLACLARSRVRELLREAAMRRMLCVRKPRVHPIRYRVARAIRQVGYAALTLGDAIAESP